MAGPTSQPALLVDGVAAKGVALPSSEGELSEILRDASTSKVVVVPVGGGTQLEVGSPPERVDLAVHTRSISGIVDYHPEDLTVTVRAGTALSALQEILRERGQFLPLTPGAPESTIGGIVACDTPGPYRTRFGGVRDLLIGAAWVRADGVLVRAGGKVVKNVTGYDLHRLQVGALGTLGVVTEATFKVLPMPRSVTSYRLESHDFAEAADWAGQLLRSSFRPLVLDVTGDAGGPWQLSLLIEGGPAVQKRAEDWLGALSGRTAAIDPADGGFRLRRAAEGETVIRASLPPAALPRFAAALPDGARAIVQPATGMVLAAMQQAAPECVVHLRSEARSCGGFLNLLAAPADVKQAAGVWDDPGPSLEIMRRLKLAYDPDRILNRGRFIGGL